MKFALIFLIFSTIAYAGVNLKNGNFYISYADIMFGNLKIIRTYNSKSTVKTEMGYGWGYEYATKMRFPEDGVTVHRHGAGGKDYLSFQSEGDRAYNSRAVLGERFINAKITASAHGIASLTGSLLSSRELREAYQRQGLMGDKDVNYHPIFNGEIAFKQPVKCSNPDCESMHGGYAFIDGDSLIAGDWEKPETLSFYYSGGLKSKSDGEGDTVRIFRYPSGKIESIRKGKDYIRFFYDRTGKSCRMVVNDGLDAELRFDNQGRLIYSRDMANNEFWFDYDRHHNLLRVGYDASDLSDELRIEYEEGTLFCSMVKHRDGTIDKYFYGKNPENPRNDYWAEEINIPNFSPPQWGYYAFLIGTREGGIRYNAKMSMYRNGRNVIRTYDQYGRLVSEDSDGTAPLELKKEGDLTLEVTGPVHRYTRTHDPEKKYLTRIDIEKIESGEQFYWAYAYELKGEQPVMQMATNGENTLNFALEDDICILSEDDVSIQIRSDGMVSANGDNWYEINFIRSETDGPLLALLRDASGDKIDVPEIQNFFNNFRLPIAVSAQQFLPEPLHSVIWKSYDL